VGYSDEWIKYSPGRAEIFEIASDEQLIGVIF
jgi:hypothetical protein